MNWLLGEKLGLACFFSVTSNSTVFFTLASVTENKNDEWTVILSQAENSSDCEEKELENTKFLFFIGDHLRLLKCLLPIFLASHFFVFSQLYDVHTSHSHSYAEWADMWPGRERHQHHTHVYFYTRDLFGRNLQAQVHRLAEKFSVCLHRSILILQKDV